MAAGSTYTPIATTTLGSTTQSYTFSSIPSTYTDLVLITSLQVASGGDNICVRLNGDTGSNYSYTRVFGNGTSALSDRGSNTTQALIGNESSSQFTTQVTHFMNYANSTTYKTILSRSNAANGEVVAWVTPWRSTSAITSILVRSAGGGGFIAGSTLTLYGIAAA